MQHLVTNVSTSLLNLCVRRRETERGGKNREGGWGRERGRGMDGGRAETD
jgi:hypothetical protein